jgi:hypothetical protein
MNPGTKPDAAAITTAEQRLDEIYPPSLKRAFAEHGLFTIGDPELPQLMFKMWPLDEHVTALAHYAEDLECDATAEAVGEAIGMEPSEVAVLADQILIGCEGHEDYIGFDLRTRHPTTHECEIGLVLRDDTEITALSEEETTPCEGAGFDRWLAKYLARRAKNGS